jgi:PAS domain S-box-containing protein
LKNKEKTKQQLQNELEESWQKNEFLSLLLKSMPVAVYTGEVGGDFRTTYISKNITALTGYKPEDFTSNSEFWSDKIHPDDQQMVNTSLSTLLETGNIAYEYRWRVSDGSYKWFYDISKLIKSPSGEISHILGTFIDINKRKRIEESLWTSEERYRLLFLTERDAIIIVDAETKRIVDANDAALRLYGYNKEEILELTGPDLSAEPEKSDAAISEMAMETDKHIHYHTRNHKKKDGTVFPVEISSGTFMLQDRKIISAVIRNITGRKQAENKLIMRARELRESNIALKVLLKQRESDKGELEENILSNVKHLIMPYIEKLKKNRSMSDELSYLNILESNLKEIISPFAFKLSSNYLDLTPREIQIASLIKDGKQDKEISEILNISIDTVQFHRKNIRKKLGIYGKGKNLRAFLLSTIKQ